MKNFCIFNIVWIYNKARLANGKNSSVAQQVFLKNGITQNGINIDLFNDLTKAISYHFGPETERNYKDNTKYEPPKIYNPGSKLWSRNKLIIDGDIGF